MTDTHLNPDEQQLAADEAARGYPNAGSGRLQNEAARTDARRVVSISEAVRYIKDHDVLNEVANPQSPEDRHRANFIGHVCTALGLEPTVDNFFRVSAALDHLDIQPHTGREYPKWVPSGRKEQVFVDGEWVDGKKDEMVVVHDEDEEAQAGRGEVIHTRPGAYGSYTGAEAPAVRVDQPVFGLRTTPALPVDDRVPSSLGVDGAKAQSGTFDEGRGPPLPPGYPNTGGRFLTEDSPDKGVPGYPNAGTGRNESAGPVLNTPPQLETEGVAHPGAPTDPRGRTNEPGYAGGKDEINAPHAGPEGYLNTGSKPTDTAGFTAADRNVPTSETERGRAERTDAQAREDLRRKDADPPSPRKPPQAPRRP